MMLIMISRVDVGKLYISLPPLEYWYLLGVAIVWCGNLTRSLAMNLRKVEE